MKSKAHTASRTFLMAMLLVGGGALVADDFRLDWYTIDGGGEMWTTGGDFNCDGKRDFDDIDPFIAVLGVPCP